VNQAIYAWSFLKEMSDEECSPRETLLKNHRKEKKDLQAQIQALKKTASKGDKKKKKEVTETIAKLEHDLSEKHKKELEDLENQTGQQNTIVESLESSEVPDEVDEDDKPLGPLPVKDGNVVRISRAQKRRDKKSTKEKLRLEEIEKQEELNKDGPRMKEQQAIKEKLTKMNLKLVEIASDGDCMFAGIEHQLKQLKISSSVKELRNQTAEELKGKPDDYSPFLTNPTTGDMLSSSEYDEYCESLRSTPAWGGQVELKAISNVLKIPIKVIQGEGPDVLVGEEFRGEPILLTYHRHLHGLGEHYNSVNHV